METDADKDWEMTMKRINPAYIEAVTGLANNCPYFKLLSLCIKSLGKGASVLDIELDKKHLQPFDMVHGGVFSSVIDAAAFWAIFTEVEEGKGLTTLEMKLNYLAPAQKGRMVAKGRCIKMGRTVALGEATITDEQGKLLSHGTATFMILPNLEYGSGKLTVPKYI